MRPVGKSLDVLLPVQSGTAGLSRGDEPILSQVAFSSAGPKLVRTFSSPPSALPMQSPLVAGLADLSAAALPHVQLFSSRQSGPPTILAVTYQVA